MAAYSSYELGFARPIAESLLSDSEFLEWVLNGTRFSSRGATPVDAAQQLSLRNKGLKNPYWFNYWCGKDKMCLCRESPEKSGIETDILIVCDLEAGIRGAIHVEVKPPGEKLLDGQAESYPRRAWCWSNSQSRPRTVLPHSEAVTILACGRELNSDERTKCFDKVVFHDDLRNRIANYPAV